MRLSRSLPPLLSHLRRRPATARGRSVLLGGTSPRAYTSKGALSSNRDPLHVHRAPEAAGAWPQLCNCCGSNQLVQRRRNLYVVLDDWEKGFSIHKLTMEDLVGGEDGDAAEPQRLPDPILRLSFRAISNRAQFHAVVSNIVVTTGNDRLSNRKENSGRGLTLVYDTETAVMEIENSLPRELDYSYDAMAAGDKLYAFDMHGRDDGRVHCLRLTEPDDIRPPMAAGVSDGSERDDDESGYSECDGRDEEGVLPHGLGPHPRWAWERIPAPPPFGFGRMVGPDEDYHSRALHPDGRTVFVSVESSSSGFSRRSEEEQEGTFSLDTASGEWTRHGDWRLPFKGQASYDEDLGAWVGTRAVYDEKSYRKHAYLCACDVPETQGGVTPEPAWKVAKDRLTFLDSSLKPIYGPKLLRTGGSVFWLVERALWPGVIGSRRYRGDPDESLLRVTMFRARYGKDGELVAVPLRSSRSYLMPRYVTGFNAPAFWI